MNFAYAGGTLTLSAACVETFEAHRQKTRFHKETGGQLFARFFDSSLVVERATVVRGARGRHSFLPNRRDEQAEIEALFQEQLHYVGDWHTHPEACPTPSGADHTKMLGIFRQSQHQLQFMLMAIVGLKPFPTGLFFATVSSTGISQLHCTD